MDKIAWILGDISIRWSSVVMVMAVLTGILFFLAAAARGNRKVTSAALALPMAILLSLLFGRLLHRYFLHDAGDGYVLMGAFAGCLCTALILKGTRLEKNTARLLDVMSIGGCAAIALGRLACFFTADDRGRIIGMQGLPLAWPVINATSGEMEYRLAVFLFQAVAALFILFVLLLVDKKSTRTGAHGDGDLTLLFLLLYTAGQIVLDSMRYDALHLRSNGFIGAVQLASAVTFAVVIGILLTRLVKRNGFCFHYGFAALLIAVCIGIAAYMEYFVQRHGGQAVFGYTVMTAAMMAAAAVGTVLWKSCSCRETAATDEEMRTGGVSACIRCVISAAVTGCLLLGMLLMTEKSGTNQQNVSGDRVLDQFFMNTTNALQDATADIRNTEKRYWISADADRAPKPNKENYGRTTDPEEIRLVIQEAETLLDGQNMYFDPNVQTLPGTDIRYYRDDTILCVTWKQEINNTAYSFSEVKIADPSQIRRYFSEGEYGSGKLVYPTEMANSVNSVCAISGDYYMFRNAGVIVYKGEVCRVNSGAHTCYVDENGDMLFTTMNEQFDMESAQRFVDDNHILFSVAFGPILVEDRQKYAFGGYGLGEVGENYARAAICQMDTLHYLLVNATGEPECPVYPTMYAFQDVIASTGCKSAYALDGGQTAAMMMNGELINSVFGGYQRKISDIVYFATALPNPQG